MDAGLSNLSGVRMVDGEVRLPPEPPQHVWTDDERARVRAMRADGASFATIAAEIGVREAQAKAQYFVGVPALIPAHLSYAPMAKVADKVVRPGIDKHLVPLCLYMGTRSFGRIHRWWNFSLAAMEQGAETLSDVAKLSHHPDFSHLCGTTSKAPLLSVQGFFTRLRDNPKVTDNISGMTEWAEMLMPRQYHFQRVPLVTFERRAAAWRVYGGKPRLPSNLREVEAPSCYPFIAHDPKRPDEGADLVALVNKAVPRGLPEEIRADICQDLICAILMGEFKREDLAGNLKDFIRAGKKMFADKWSFYPLDGIIPGTDGLTLADTL